MSIELKLRKFKRRKSIDTLLKVLLNNLSPTDEIYDAVVLLESQFGQLEEHKNIIEPKDYDAQYNRLRWSLLKLINNLPVELVEKVHDLLPPERALNYPSFTVYWKVALAVLITILIIAVLWMNNNTHNIEIVQPSQSPTTINSQKVTTNYYYPQTENDTLSFDSIK